MNSTRQNFDNSPGAAGERVLVLLKTHGPMGTAALAGRLGISSEAVRQLVTKLQQAELLEGQLEPSTQAGRPRQLWTLTTRGHARFPDAHGQLTAELLDGVRALFGEEGLDRLIARREASSRAAYARACADARTLGERAVALAAARDAEGYMARVERDGRDWLLIEDHCPICVAAQNCQGFCRSELKLFRETLGAEADVQREQHLLAGARRCVYRIRRRAGTAAKAKRARTAADRQR